MDWRNDYQNDRYGGNPQGSFNNPATIDLFDGKHENPFDEVDGLLAIHKDYMIKLKLLEENFPLTTPHLMHAYHRTIHLSPKVHSIGLGIEEVLKEYMLEAERIIKLDNQVEINRIEIEIENYLKILQKIHTCLDIDYINDVCAENGWMFSKNRITTEIKEKELSSFRAQLLKTIKTYKITKETIFRV